MRWASRMDMQAAKHSDPELLSSWHFDFTAYGTVQLVGNERLRDLKGKLALNAATSGI